ncbi:hypothetical protein SEVIR_2G275600v4 [Setaria viridis]|uniref:Nucleotide-diphospho-sugar transferase domain-containing protein n=2 Tax=Setaria TaxID=4554 RepID=K3ZUR0_SETIT|nr:uncharacterized protein At4g15970 [Setaria italica]XP_034582701.1 uncharacterized protein At4g15970-like [Setaria viridis]RCV12381.1 hypothetical protein SETIT_2G265000v2 [Setaria italica]TKW33992.1 hypothetical protein SEVIR_2G275600v2 [Setaria viridis]
MNTVRNLVRFLLVAAISTVACVVLLLQRSPCPCDSGAVVAPAARGDLAVAGGNGRTQQAHPSGMQAAAASPRDKDDGELAQVLRRAAMEDNTIIMTFTNEAFAAPGSLMDLFLESFRVGLKTEQLLKHLVIVAADAKAFARCRQVHPHCYALAMGATNFTGEQRFMAGDYLDMMWRRNRFQARVLGLGYSFVFTDVDIVWFRNPLLRIPVAVDFAMSCDMFYGDNPYDLNKRANGGFVYARASARTVAFYDAWYEAREAHPDKNEQDLFDKLKRELSARSGVAAQFVDTDYLGGFCESGKRRDFNKLCTYHGNCLVGLGAKLQRLRGVLDEWKEFKAKAGKPGSNVTALTD